MLQAALLLVTAGMGPSNGPTANGLFELIQRTQLAVAGILKKTGGVPDPTYSIKRITSHRCKATNPGQYFCTVRYLGLYGRRFVKQMYVEKSRGIWFEVRP